MPVLRPRDRYAYLTRYKNALRTRKVASPWVRVIIGPQRGHCFRGIGPSDRVWARNDLEKVAADHSLRAAGFQLLNAPAGCDFE